MNDQFTKAVIEGAPIYYVKFYDYTDGMIKERGAIQGELSEFMLHDLVTEVENRLIEIKKFEQRQ